jgi:glucosamine-6-phosphate deaminase
MNLKIFASASVAAEFVADEIINLVVKKPSCRLGLATGRTMDAIYFHLVNKSLELEVDFSGVIAFAVDEYIGLKDKSENSYEAYLNLHLFNHLNFRSEHIIFPKVNSLNVDETCFEFEEQIRACGGIDLQLLGIGLNGHIGLNEPGSSLDSRTRVVALTGRTLKSNRVMFKEENIPLTAVTMGIGTILESKKCLLIATGETKAEIIQKVVNGDINSKVPATAIKEHKNHLVVLDNYAAKLI